MDSQKGKQEIVYQVYPKSFCDGNGDGIGDLRGILKRLDYLNDLGVTVLWICPVYASPMEDLEKLIYEAGIRGMKIMMDLVLNHTSDEHLWFQNALRDQKSRYSDYYIFKKSREGRPPSNLRSVFGGSVWEPVEGAEEYYFHSFSKRQPDLNWENEDMRKELYEMIRWWMERMDCPAVFRIQGM